MSDNWIEKKQKKELTKRYLKVINQTGCFINNDTECKVKVEEKINENNFIKKSSPRVIDSKCDVKINQKIISFPKNYNLEEESPRKLLFNPKEDICFNKFENKGIPITQSNNLNKVINNQILEVDDPEFNLIMNDIKIDQFRLREIENLLKNGLQQIYSPIKVLSFKNIQILTIEDHLIYKSLNQFNILKKQNQDPIIKNYDSGTLNNAFIQTFNQDLFSDKSLRTQIDLENGYTSIDRRNTIILNINTLKEISTDLVYLTKDLPNFSQDLMNSQNNFVQLIKHCLEVLKIEHSQKENNKNKNFLCEFDSDLVIKAIENDRNYSDMDVFKQILTEDYSNKKEFVKYEMKEKKDFETNPFESSFSLSLKNNERQIVCKNKKLKTTNNNGIKIDDLLNEVREIRYQMESIEQRLCLNRLEEASSVSFNITKI